MTVQRAGENGEAQKVRLTTSNWLVILGMLGSLASGGLISYIAMRDRMISVETRSTSIEEKLDAQDKRRLEDKAELLRRFERVEDAVGRLRVGGSSTER